MSTYVVVDLEMCNVSGENRRKLGHPREIIEIGAVLLDENLNITDKFNTFVLPQFGRVDRYIEKLTNIKNNDLVSAPNLKDALELFFAWMPEDAVMVAWSNNDASQLKKETAHKKIKFEKLDLFLKDFLDCQAMFGEKMKTEKVYRLSEAISIANVEYISGAHDALIDAENTARLFYKIMSDSDFSLNPYYTNETQKVSTYCPFADLLMDFSLAG